MSWSRNQDEDEDDFHVDRGKPLCYTCVQAAKPHVDRLSLPVKRHRGEPGHSLPVRRDSGTV